MRLGIILPNIYIFPSLKIIPRYSKHFNLINVTWNTQYFCEHSIMLKFISYTYLLWKPCRCCVNELTVVNSCLSFFYDLLISDMNLNIPSLLLLFFHRHLQLYREFKFLTELNSYRYFVCRWRSILSALT